MRPTDFVLFSATHLAILAGIGVVAGLLVWVGRRYPSVVWPLCVGQSIFLAINELIWYTYRYTSEGFRFPEGLPLQLCDVMVWLTAAALVGRWQAVFETAFLVGIGGAGMALLTPDLWAPLATYPSIYFFLAHGAIVAGMVFLVGTGQRQLEPGCVKRVFLGVNAFVLFVAGFNAVFGTNYMYLCRKPKGASLLDAMGPWPVYLLAGEALALVVLWLLWLPFRLARRRSV